MKSNKDCIMAVIGKTLLIMILMLLPGMFLDIFYRMGIGIWYSWRIVSVLRYCNITYSNSFKILGGSFGVIVSIVSMFLTINNNISERFEKKVFGIPRAELYEGENGIYKYMGRMCLCAPVLMMLFLNLEFCMSGYLVFCYCMLFVVMHYYRYDSSYSRPLDKMVCRIMRDLPREELWTQDTLSAYQLLLECIGQSAEEEGNWQEIESLYLALIDAQQEYDYDKRYLTAFYFYRIVFWGSGRKSRIGLIPMDILIAYLDMLDIEAGADDLLLGKNWPMLWAMMKAAVFEADERELIRFLEYFYDFPRRSGRVLQKTKIYTLDLNIMREQAGILLVLLEYRFIHMPPEDEQFVELLKKAWESGMYAFKYEGYKHTGDRDSTSEIAFADERYDCVFVMRMMAQNMFEEDRAGLEEVLENLMYDCNNDNDSRRSLIANIIRIEIGR